MATRTVTTLVDDVDGSEAEESIEFALDGVVYQIDLSGANAEAMREALGPWVDAGRRTGGRRQMGGGYRNSAPPAATRPKITVEMRGAIQRFAEAQGFPVPASRGRIAATVVDAWEEAGRPQ